MPPSKKNKNLILIKDLIDDLSLGQGVVLSNNRKNSVFQKTFTVIIIKLKNFKKPFVLNFFY